MSFYSNQYDCDMLESYDDDVWSYSDSNQDHSPEGLPYFLEAAATPEDQSLEAVFRWIDATLGNDCTIESLYNIYLKGHTQQFHCFNSSPEKLELFQFLPIEQWNGEDCFDWACSVSNMRQIDFFEVYHRNFKNLTGSALLQFTQRHFCEVAGDLYGAVFYQDFVDLRAKTKGCQVTESKSSSSDFGDDNLWLSSEEFQPLDYYIPDDQTWNTGSREAIDCNTIEERNIKMEDSYEDVYLVVYQKDNSGPPETVTQAVCEKIKTKSRKGERGPKVWEFLMRLLADPSTNPELIRWDESSSATFVLSQPAIIAQLWGTRAGKSNLSANNFARALRYHYSTGALVAVSERHYMYKCGPKALQYLDDLRTGSPCQFF